MFPIFYVRDIFGTIYKSRDIFLICIKCFKSLLNELNKLKPLTSYYNKCKKSIKKVTLILEMVLEY